jgi:putative cell wall-binding protein
VVDSRSACYANGFGSVLGWSPDGAWLVFDGDVGGSPAGRSQVQAVHPDGSGLRAVYVDSSEGAGLIEGFSTDGTRVLLVSGDATTVVDSPISGSAAVVYRAATGTTVTSAAWLPGAADVVVSLQSSGSGAQTVKNLALVPVGGGPPRLLTGSGAAEYPSVVGPVVRVAGATRVDTAVSASRSTFSTAPVVVVARDDLYADALAAAPLAAKVGGPLLLTDPRAASSALLAEVQRLRATTAYIVGDQSAVSARVADQLQGVGVTTVTRIGGPGRYDTAALIAERVGGASAYLVRGDDWPDAASAAALAAFQQRPVILTPASALAPGTARALAALHTTSVTIVGGPHAVSADVEAVVRGFGVVTSRLSGADRYATSAAVATAARTAGMSGAPWLTNGQNWPDAISAGPAAAVAAGPLVLVDPSNLQASPATAAWLAEQRPSRVVAVGGPDVVSAADVAAAGGQLNRVARARVSTKRERVRGRFR